MGDRRTSKLGLGALVALSLAASVLVAAAPSVGAGPPPVSGRLAFSSTRYGDAEIVTMDADGAAPTRLTYELEAAGSPGWSPDGGDVAYDIGYDAQEREFGQIIITDGVTRTPSSVAADVPLDAVGHGYSQPTWSPDGTKLAFRLGVEGPFGTGSAGTTVFHAVGTSALDGSDRALQSTSGPDQHHPTWSPDGSRLAYQDELAVVTADVGGQDDPDTLVPEASHPAWSPDGTHVAYQALGPGEQMDVFVVDLVGGTPVRLTTDSAFDGAPTWSPDGTQIAFESHRDDNAEIYVMDADGQDQVNLTNDPAEDVDPDWSRDCPDDCTGPLAAPPTPPAAPTDVTATGGDRQATVTFAPDEHPWPSVYTVTASPGGATVSGTASPLTVGALPNGTSYTFTVAAASDVGASAPGGPSDPTPVACPVAPDHGLTDVPAWIDAAVSWALDRPVAIGYDDDTFRPNQAITRAQVAAMLHRLLGSPFLDEPPATVLDGVPVWVELAVSWLHVHGVIAGYPDNSFRPKLPVTRAQLAGMLHRIAGSPDVDGLDPHGLTDVPAWVDDAVTWLVDSDVLTGYPDLTFRPHVAVTRAEAIRMLFRLDCASPWIGPTALD